MTWTNGDVGLSQTLTDNDHLYPSHINELRVALDVVGDTGVFNAKYYGATGDGVTDDTTTLQAWLTASAGKTALLPAGDYLISTALTVSADTTILAYGARIFNTTTSVYLLNLDSGCKVFGLEIEGTGYATSSILARGISIVGTSGSEKENILIQDCYIHDIAFYGILFDYCKDGYVKYCKIENIGYAGVATLSCDNINIDHCHIKNVASDQTNEYGVSFSSLNDAANPRTQYSSVTNCLIEDVTGWEGIDTHGGKAIRIENNVIKGCLVGIVLKMRPSSGTAVDSATDCIVKGNIVYGGGSDGIYINGTTDVYASNNIVEGNTLYECGIPTGDFLDGAIQISRTYNTVVSNNNIVNPYVTGISIGRTNSNISIVGNTIVDPQSDTTGTYGIYVYQGTGVTISGNNLYLRNATLNDYVAQYGIIVAGQTGNNVTIGANNNNYTTPLVISNTTMVSYGQFGATNAKLYTNGATPESAITAPIGSLCINTAGGAGTTLYVKESGASNTGWVGK